MGRSTAAADINAFGHLENIVAAGILAWPYDRRLLMSLCCVLLSELLGLVVGGTTHGGRARIRLWGLSLIAILRRRCNSRRTFEL